MADPNEILFRTQKNEADAVQALIDGGVDPSYANGVGQTALHVACLWGNIDVAKVLVKAGAKVNAVNGFSGAAPLHCAATENERGNKEGRKECIKLLMTAGADPNLRDMRGKKPQQYTVPGSGVRTLLGAPEEPGPDEEEEMEEEEEIELLDDSEKTPVTLVTGFLGSGKTTLINYILKEQHGKKIAVIENEFGSLDIDSSLVKDKLQAKEDVISMDNGCVCCTVRGDLVKAFVTLSAREEKYDAVIIETTGMADPAPVAYTFNTKAEVGAQYRIDSILCVVDAKHVQQHLDEVRPTGVVNEAVNQVAFADKILLNKIDLVTPEEKAKVRESLASINAMAKVIETQQSRANLDELLGIGSFSLESVSHMLDNVLDEDEPEAQDGHAHTHAHGEGETCNHPSHGHGHAHAHEGGPTSKKPKRSEHLSGVSSVGIIVDGPLDEQKFNGFMVHLIQTKAADLYRCKGVVALQGSDEKHVFHGVHEQIAFAPVDEGWAEGEKRVCKLVFIGRNLDKPALDKAAQACKA